MSVWTEREVDRRHLDRRAARRLARIRAALSGLQKTYCGLRAMVEERLSEAAPNAATETERMMSAQSPNATRQTDVAIVGGGLAGSMAAAMLGRAGIDAVLIDPHPVYPADFRCEKLDGSQVRILEKTGLADAVLRATTPDREVWVARFGRVVETRPGDQRGIFYAHAGQHGARANSGHVAFIEAKATGCPPAPPADGHAVEWRAGFRAAHRLGQRPEYRLAPHARHDAQDHQRMSFGQHRLRHQAGRPRAVRFLRR